MNLDINKIPFDDQKTWQLIQSGYNACIFQSESDLFHHWLKKIKPKNIWELSILVALMRPGCLGSGMADDYLKYRNDSSLIESFGHSIIDDIVSTTGNVLVFQEQIMQLGNRLAWSNLPPKERDLKVDILRKAIGKKNQQKILEIGRDFVDGFANNKIDKELADKLFEIIKKCGRYAFNLSHSAIYAHLAYKTAYLKANYPLQTYCVYLTYAKEKLDKWAEIHKIISECKILGHEILNPNFNIKNANFMIQNNNIIYGLSHIKYGPSIQTLQEYKDIPIIDDWKKFIYLICKQYNCSIRSNTLEALISVGAFRDTRLGRKTLLNIYNFMDSLTDKEKKKICEAIIQIDNLYQLPDLVISLIPSFMGKRKEIVKSNLQFLKLDEYDIPAWIESIEKNYLGISLNTSSVDDKYFGHTDSCKDCLDACPLYTKKQIAVVLDSIRQTTVKNGSHQGDKMAIISVHDSSASINNLPVFPELYNSYTELLRENNNILLDIYKNKSGWIINKIQQI